MTIKAFLLTRFLHVRITTGDFFDDFTDEECFIQAATGPECDTSPPIWHLGHTSLIFLWAIGREPRRPEYSTIFNSYYNAVGEQWRKENRRNIPVIRSEIESFRREVNDAVTAFIEALPDDASLAQTHDLQLAIAHEEQHQELLLMDIKAAGRSRFKIFRTGVQRRQLETSVGPGDPLAHRFIEIGALHNNHRISASVVGRARANPFLTRVGHDEPFSFAYDIEQPLHHEVLYPFALGNRLVTCGEYREFIADGGYRKPLLWLDNGWRAVRAEGWTAPLYWEDRGADGLWIHALDTEDGLRPLDPSEPVCHVSHFEADAYARWRGARLPTEVEMEYALRRDRGALHPPSPRFLEQSRFHPPAERSWPYPFAGQPDYDNGIHQLQGVAWQPTSSSFGPYPGFQPFGGQWGEYNAKFMNGQTVFRGSAVVTPECHVRPSYRNFFPSPKRWAFTGIRLARDL